MENKEPWVMHSTTYGCLFDLRLILFRHGPDFLKSIPTFDGRDVVVDDRAPTNPVLDVVARMIILEEV